eukprot:TRINITY_DN30411_c0_g1_i5.p1 TRINITY_DN30411_c0_g1~~TRINITY_DN30411_c0_g1_i5.p1  ORF type:complete len:367 (+),score=67.30 TRINITY_DN30411_c0_g1_i5:18-1118(+)
MQVLLPYPKHKEGHEAKTTKRTWQRGGGGLVTRSEGTSTDFDQASTSPDQCRTGQKAPAGGLCGLQAPWRFLEEDRRRRRDVVAPSSPRSTTRVMGKTQARLVHQLTRSSERFREAASQELQTDHYLHTAHCGSQRRSLPNPPSPTSPSSPSTRRSLQISPRSARSSVASTAATSVRSAAQRSVASEEALRAALGEGCRSWWDLSALARKRWLRTAACEAEPAWRGVLDELDRRARDGEAAMTEQAKQNESMDWQGKSSSPTSAQSTASRTRWHPSPRLLALRNEERRLVRLGDYATAHVVQKEVRALEAEEVQTKVVKVEQTAKQAERARISTKLASSRRELHAALANELWGKVLSGELPNLDTD